MLYSLYYIIEINKVMYTYKAKVIRIVDGDTIEVDLDLGMKISVKTKLRLADIDTPETYRPLSEEERTHGKEATAFVSNLILDKYVTVRTKKTGKYGRYIAHVELADGRDLTTLLIENGFEKRTAY